MAFEHVLLARRPGYQARMEHVVEPPLPRPFVSWKQGLDLLFVQQPVTVAQYPQEFNVPLLNLERYWFPAADVGISVRSFDSHLVYAPRSQLYPGWEALKLIREFECWVG